MTITESTRRQLFWKTTSRPQVIRMDQKRHAQKAKAAATAAKTGAAPLAQGTWTVEEHQLFLAALELYPSGPWKRVAEYVGTRTPRQVMTHAQKYRQRLQRRATNVVATEREAPRPAAKEVEARVLSVVVSPLQLQMPMHPAGATGEIQVEAGICVTNGSARPAPFADEPPSYGHFPLLDVDFDFLTQLVSDPMFDSVDVSLPRSHFEPLQF
ncbi:Myb-like DNA-binding protein [Phytophthora cinnamomi]|uniref:Myb-like DNA-binding protein n=1 Tax=Phytophthora cinnamomi TaxID=4785 RepID=UPI003559BA16|nr:Myb-like DNA-binding protein [Phytophthora cinnamomi]